MTSSQLQQTSCFKMTELIKTIYRDAAKAKNIPDINVKVSREITGRITKLYPTSILIFSDLPEDLNSPVNMEYARALFKLAHEADSSELLDFVAIYLNIIFGFFPSQKGPILDSLKTYGFNANTSMSILDFAEDRVGVDIHDLEDYESVYNQVMYATLGIYLILIGKRLNTLNSAQWLKNRTRTFCQSVGIMEEDNLVERCCPSEIFAISVYAFIAPKFDLRKILFETINTNSSTSGTVGKLMKTCLTLLAGTEIGNFLLCYKFIMLENPILLCWQELAKYSPYLISAAEKFNALGDNGVYCKFLYPQENLQELARDKLKIFAAIAREIAIMEGFVSFQNYRGADASPTTQELVTRAMDLVKRSGGANTQGTQDMRESLLAPKGNEEILKLLDIGAFSQRTGHPTPIGASPSSN